MHRLVSRAVARAPFAGGQWALVRSAGLAPRIARCCFSTTPATTMPRKTATAAPDSFEADLEDNGASAGLPTLLATPAAASRGQAAAGAPACRSLRVALVGAPNAGKSTLTNALCLTKVSAVSPKYNTTREKAVGYLHFPQQGVELVFVDTPGLLPTSSSSSLSVSGSGRGSRKYVKSLVTAAADALKEVDAVLLVVDAARRWDEEQAGNLHIVAQACAAHGAHLLLVPNKLDLVRQTERLGFGNNSHSGRGAASAAPKLPSAGGVQEVAVGAAAAAANGGVGVVAPVVAPLLRDEWAAMVEESLALARAAAEARAAVGGADAAPAAAAGELAAASPIDSPSLPAASDTDADAATVTTAPTPQAPLPPRQKRVRAAAQSLAAIVGAHLDRFAAACADVQLLPPRAAVGIGLPSSLPAPAPPAAASDAEGSAPAVVAAFPVAARYGEGIADLRAALVALAPPTAAWQFAAGDTGPEGASRRLLPSVAPAAGAASQQHAALGRAVAGTALSPQQRVHEIIREKLYLNLHAEVPYLVTQRNRGWRWYTQRQPGEDGGGRRLPRANTTHPDAPLSFGATASADGGVSYDYRHLVVQSSRSSGSAAGAAAAGSTLIIDQDLIVPRPPIAGMLRARSNGALKAIGAAATADIRAALGVDDVRLFLHVVVRDGPAPPGGGGEDAAAGGGGPAGHARRGAAAAQAPTPPPGLYGPASTGPDPAMRSKPSAQQQQQQPGGRGAARATSAPAAVASRAVAMAAPVPWAASADDTAPARGRGGAGRSGARSSSGGRPPVLLRVDDDDGAGGEAGSGRGGWRGGSGGSTGSRGGQRLPREGKQGEQLQRGRTGARLPGPGSPRFVSAPDGSTRVLPPPSRGGDWERGPVGPRERGGDSEGRRGGGRVEFEPRPHARSAPPPPPARPEAEAGRDFSADPRGGRGGWSNRQDSDSPPRSESAPQRAAHGDRRSGGAARSGGYGGGRSRDPSSRPARGSGGFGGGDASSNPSRGRRATADANGRGARGAGSNRGRSPSSTGGGGRRTAQYR